jgi:hypothetical protein
METPDGLDISACEKAVSDAKIELANVILVVGSEHMDVAFKYRKLGGSYLGLAAASCSVGDTDRELAANDGMLRAYESEIKVRRDLLGSEDSELPGLVERTENVRFNTMQLVLSPIVELSHPTGMLGGCWGGILPVGSSVAGLYYGVSVWGSWLFGIGIALVAWTFWGQVFDWAESRRYPMVRNRIVGVLEERGMSATALIDLMERFNDAAPKEFLAAGLLKRLKADPEFGE